jgi:hypothetical protein
MGLSVFGLHRLAFPGIAFLFLGVIIGCNEPGIIGLDVQPKSDQIGAEFSDTTSLITYIVKEDSLRTDEPLLQLVGSYIDPVFGYSAASSYVEFSLPSNNVNFGVNFIPDSLVMYLGYAGFYGDAISAQTVLVYQLTEEIHADSSYYSGDDFDYNTTPLATQSVAPEEGDTMIQFKFDTPVFSQSDSEFVDNAAFQLFLKGFYITTDITENGGILYLDMHSPYTKLTLYYNDTLSFDFLIDLESGRSNHFEHNYENTVISSQLSDSTLGESMVYVQPMEGVKTVIQFPFLEKWANSGNIVVNKAELVLQVDVGIQTETYAPPDYLFIMGAGETAAIIDQYIGASYFGGEYDVANGQYRFNIARHVHGILDGDIQNEGLFLIVANNLLLSGSVVSGNRVVLGGSKNATIPIKLNITYTIL